MPKFPYPVSPAIELAPDGTPIDNQSDSNHSSKNMNSSAAPNGSKQVANVEDLMINLFGLSAVRKSKTIIDRNQASLSFTRNRDNHTFIASGLVHNNERFSCRITLKLEGDQFGLVSKCNCLTWTEDQHCEHTGAILLKFFIENINSNSQLYHHIFNSQENSRPSSSNLAGSKGVRPQKFGNLVTNIEEFSIHGIKRDYFSLQYQLNSGQTISLPAPLPADDLFLFVETNSFGQAVFSLGNNNKPQIENRETNISLIEDLFVFDWESGKLYEQPLWLKPIFKLRNSANINYARKDSDKLLWTDLYHYVNKNNLSDSFRFIHADKLLDPANAKPLAFETEFTPLTERETRCHIYLRPWSQIAPQKDQENNQKKETMDTVETKVSFPAVLQVFCFKDGLLNSFSASSELTHFFKLLIEGKFLEAKDFVRSSSKSLLIERFLEILQEEKIYHLCPLSGEFWSIDIEETLSLFNGLGADTGILFIKNATYSAENISLIIEHKSSLQMREIGQIYQKVASKNHHFKLNGKPLKLLQFAPRIERGLSMNNWFQFSVDLSSDEKKIIQHYNEGKKIFFEAEDNIQIIDEKSEKLINFISRNQGKSPINPDELQEESQEGENRTLVGVHRARIFEVFELIDLGYQELLSNEEIELCHKLIQLDKMPSYPVPDDLKGEPRAYQAVGYQWLRFLHEYKFGACLADDMGLGKTFQAIMFLSAIRKTSPKTIIACPVSILSNWKNEIEKFSDLKVNVYHGEQREMVDSDVVITSYGILRREFEAVFKDLEYDVFIMDEAQCLKNHKSLSAQIARKLKARFRLSLTGTPLENNVIEYFNIIDLSIPGIWNGSEVYGQRAKRKTDIDLVRKISSPFVLRRTKDKVLSDLPPKTESHVFLDFSKEERISYEKSLAGIQDTLRSDSSKNLSTAVLKGILKLRQLCLWNPEIANLSTKVSFLMDQLEQVIEEGHFSLIFSQFTSYLDVIEKSLNQKNIEFARLDGSQTLKKRNQQIEEFQAGKKRVFLISLKAGGFGINLTNANYIFLMDPWWNPAVENQAIDRAHRIGQNKNVLVYRPIIKDSVEEKVLELQKSKKLLFDQILSRDNTSTGVSSESALSLDELKQIIGI